jgi:hypothetical protein
MGRSWTDANPEKVRANRRRHYEVNREKVKVSSRTHYAANAEKVKAHHAALRAERQGMLDYMKRAYGCEACGTKTGRLDYHHCNPKTKSFSIASGLSRAWPVILSEIEKCVVLCAPCHGKAEGRIKKLKLTI